MLVRSRRIPVVRVACWITRKRPETSHTVPQEGEMKAAFWRFAHAHYHGKSLSSLTDLAALTWALFFLLVYGTALLSGWWPNASEAMVGVILIGAPLTFGIAHRRIRLEASKEPAALYRKRTETTR